MPNIKQAIFAIGNRGMTSGRQRGNIAEIGKQQIRGVKTSDAMAILKEKGIEVTEEKADLILDLLYFFAKLTVSQLIKNNNKGDLKRKSK